MNNDNNNSTVTSGVLLQTPSESAENGQTWHDLLLRYRWRIFGQTLTGALLFALIALLVPPRYESVAQLMPPDQKSTAGPFLDAALDRTGVGSAVDSVTRTTGALFVAILSSRTVKDALIQRLDLQRVYRTRSRQSARKTLEANTEISEDRKSGVITLRVRDKDRLRAQAMCQMYVNELNRLSNQLSTSAASREREFLEHRLSVVKQELDHSAGSLGQFSSTNTTIDISQQAKAMVDASATLQGQLIAAESELKGLKEIYGDGNVRVLSLQSRVAELRRKLHMLTGQDSGAGSNPDVPYPSIRQLPLLGVTYSDLLRQTTLNEAVYEALTKQYEIAKVQEVRDTPSVRLLDLPSYPEKKVYPPRLLIAMFGGLLGLALALSSLLWSVLYARHPGKALVLDTLQAYRGDLINMRVRARQVWKRP